MADFGFIFGAYFLARFFTSGQAALPLFFAIADHELITVIFSCYFAFVIFGYYRTIWRYIDMSVISKYIKGVTAAVLFTYFFSSLTRLGTTASVKPFIIFWLFLLVSIIGSRLFFNIMANFQRKELSKTRKGEKTLIYGAGESGEMILHFLLKYDEIFFIPLGFIDDDPKKKGREINGYQIWSGIEEIEPVLLAQNIKRIIVSTRYINQENRQRLEEICRNYLIKLCNFRLEFDDLLEQSLSESKYRIVKISGT
jgi:FlaA1/EpsC-like NDP-sugar epimerase